jgi:hypothetical protein
LAFERARPNLVGSNEVIQKTTVALVFLARHKTLFAKLEVHANAAMRKLLVGCQVTKFLLLVGHRNVQNVNHSFLDFENFFRIFVLAGRGQERVPTVKVVTVEQRRPACFIRWRRRHDSTGE